jgi:hypothetical protein
VRTVLKVVGGALSMLLLVGAATYVAGEQTEVARLRTFDASGAPHETKLWVVDHDGAAWVRVARPDRGWFQRLEANPRIELIRGDAARAVVAKPDRSPAARAAIDGAFRAKYGLTDWWYGVLLRSDAVPVRLDAAAAP